jgi:hypothetical protein
MKTGLPFAKRPMSIEQADARFVATEIRRRYEPLRSVTLIGRCMLRALFDGRSDDVVFWALVHAHYRETPVNDRLEQQLEALVKFRREDPSELQ